MKNALLALTLLMAIVACRNNTTTPAKTSANAPVTASATSLTPEQLGEIGASIKKHPSEGTKILSDHGMTQEQFERAIRQVSSDPEASKRYAAAYKRNV
jgi:ABC-type enterochelin transport system substrate-binding protein